MKLVCFALLLGLTAIPAAVFGQVKWRLQSGPPAVRFRDSRTGASVKAAVAADIVPTISTGNDLQVTVTAAGYSSLVTHLSSQSLAPIVFWLDPIANPQAMPAPDTAAASGETVIQGHVFDANGEPVAAAQISLISPKSLAVSDGAGFFSLTIKTPPVDPVGDRPQTSDLRVSVAGSILYERKNILLAAGASHYVIDLGESGHMQMVDGTHKLYLSKEQLARTQSLEDEILPTEHEPLDTPSEVVVPSSIRVGSSCGTKTTCSVINVYTLDTYVRLGLDDEWISSWNTNSLKAGAIAYRSYGVYHVFHPLTANYDICNTTSCQVMDPSDSASSVDTATQQTTGSIVTDSTGSAPFFAEYAAENNGSACPDGYTGNNSTWPCMSDMVDAGQTFNGHGRGMCQWGTQRWSVNEGKDFVWIVDHYYNNNGDPSGLRNGVLQLSPNSVLPPPEMTDPGTETAPGAATSTLTPTFDWSPVSGADGYGLYISKYNGSTYDLIYSSETAAGQPLAGSSFTLPSGLLVNGGQYRWNMSTHNAAGYGSANTYRSYFFVSLSATVSGRVATPQGTGLRGATVVLSDGAANDRRVLTSSLGFFSFDGIATGRSYTVSVASKRYRFSTQTIEPSGDLTMDDIVGLE